MNQSISKPGYYAVKMIIAVLVLLLCVSSNSVAQAITFEEVKVEKPRLLVLTDISNEPDDQQSLVRLLAYANEFNIVGIIATTSTWLRNKTRPDIVKDVISGYGQVRENLLLHAEGYPEAGELIDEVYAHLPEFGMEGVGAGKSSPGSDHIIKVVDQSDDRPVWITVWGGANALAQALWDVRNTRSPQEVSQFIEKIKVYTISDQDDAGPWIRSNFPELFYIVSPSPPDAGWYHEATWTGIAGDQHYSNGPFHKFELVDEPWLAANIRHDHGPLGEHYLVTHYIMEGDTPSFLGLIRNGLGWSVSPEYGGWGGRYQLCQPLGAVAPFWSNNRQSRDKVRAEDGRYYTSDQATIWRWREHYQHDFAARMDWNIMTYEAANHNPEVVVNGYEGKSILRTSVRVGDVIHLNAGGSTDPDGDQHSYKWFIYPEASNYDGGTWSIEQLAYREWWVENEAMDTSPDKDKIVLSGINGSTAKLIIGEVPDLEDVHVMLQVTDDGEPALTSYRRMVFQVN